MVQVTLETHAAIAADSDAVVVTAFEDGLSPAAQEVDSALDGVLSQMRESKEITGKFGERVVLHTLGRLPSRRVLVLGLGKAGQLDTFRLHNAWWFAGNALRKQGVHSVSAHLDDAVVAAISGHNGEAPAAFYDTLHSAATGLLMGNFQGDLQKSERDDRGGIEQVAIAGLSADGENADDALRQAVVLAQATNQVREWVTMPSNRLTPTLFARSVRTLCEGTGLELDVLEKADLEREGAGALLGVAKGSDEPPVMMVVRWDGGRPDGPRLALVGKGITFDTGGISIKPSAGMETMKFDMGGAAAVLGAMWAISQLKPKANVIGVVPATENMPGGRAYKPGDVLTSMSGKTIEVTNTDAEGRIILSDGLAYARRLGATHLVDVATLTGAMVVALGHVNAGLLSNDDSLAEMLLQAARRGGDRFARLPLDPEYDVCLTSEVADVKNLAGRQGGGISAAVFLREFAGDLPWAHLDIAGTVWNDQPDMSQIPRGPSGAPTRSFVHLAFEFAKL